MGMKGYLRTFEAIFSAIIILSLLISVKPESEKFEVKNIIELNSTQIYGKNITYLRKTFKEFYPLNEISFKITNYEFLQGFSNNSTILHFSGENLSRANLILWSNNLQNITVKFNNNLIYSSEIDGILRIDLNDFKQINSLELNFTGAYNLLMERTYSYGNLNGKKLNYFYYDNFKPLHLEVFLK